MGVELFNTHTPIAGICGVALARCGVALRGNREALFSCCFLRSVAGIVGAVPTACMGKWAPMRGFRSALIVVLGWGAVVRAAPSQADKIAAEALFDAGRALAKDGKLAEACPKFAESNRLDPGVGVLLYLADCYEKTGKLASAWLTWREALAAARVAKQADREKLAAQRASALESQLTRLQVDVPAESAVPGLVVLQDGAEVGSVLWGTPIPLDPGEHTLEARAPGRRSWSRTLLVGKQASVLAVRIPVLEKDAAPSVASTAPAASSAPVASAEPPPPPPPLPSSTLPPTAPAREEAPAPPRAVMLGARLGGLLPVGGTGATATGRSLSLSDLYGPGAALELDAGLRIGQHLTGYGWFNYGMLSSGSTVGQDGAQSKGAERQALGVGLQVATSHDTSKIGFYGEVGALLFHRYRLREEVSGAAGSCSSTTTLAGNAARLGGGVHIPMGGGVLLTPFVNAEIGRFVQASYEGSGTCATRSGNYEISQREVHASVLGGAAFSYGFGL